MVRRLKDDIREIQGGFPNRNVKRLSIDGLPPDAPELQLSRLLDEYRTAREQRHAQASNKAKAAAGLLVVGLQQRLLSSIEAFARSLKVHSATVERHWANMHQVEAHGTPVPEAHADAELFLKPADADDERAAWRGEEAEAEEEAQIKALTLAAEKKAADMEATLWAKEQELLRQMRSIAEDHRHLPDAKTHRLIDWMRENQCSDLPPLGQPPSSNEPAWNNRRMLIFTENREGTKRYLKNMLEQAIEGTDRADERIEIIDGLTSSPVAGRSSAASMPTPRRIPCAS